MARPIAWRKGCERGIVWPQCAGVWIELPDEDAVEAKIGVENVAASLAVKALFLALALAGYASLWGAIAADMGVSLLVVFNAMRLLSRARRGT